MQRHFEIVAFVIVVAVITVLGMLPSAVQVAADERGAGTEASSAAAGSTPSQGNYQANYQADYHADYSVKGTNDRVKGTDDAPARRDERSLQRDWRSSIGVDRYGRPLSGGPR